MPVAIYAEQSFHGRKDNEWGKEPKYNFIRAINAKEPFLRVFFPRVIKVSPFVRSLIQKHRRRQIWVSLLTVTITEMKSGAGEKPVPKRRETGVGLEVFLTAKTIRCTLVLPLVINNNVIF